MWHMLTLASGLQLQAFRGGTALGRVANLKGSHSVTTSLTGQKYTDWSVILILTFVVLDDVVDGIWSRSMLES
jgi:hypothetical protein